MVSISQAADDLIIASEVSSKATYEKKYRRPEWPGGLSGVTIAIGYDLGYASSVKVKADWGDRLPGSMIDAMLTCVGVTKAAAQAMTARVRDKIDVPWNDAIYVYEHVDIPEWTGRVIRAVPKSDKLSPDCLGALTSLAYNRGASFNNAGDRYREMRAIRSHIFAGELDRVDDEIRSMKRLWPGVRGLLIRRDKEADIWNIGLRSIAGNVPLPKSKPKETPAPLVPIPPAGTPETGTGGGGAILTGGGAQQAAAAGWDPWIVGGIVVGGIVLTGLAIWAVRNQRSQPVMARAKG